MSATKNAGRVAVGMFLLLSVIVFGSILYVGFTSINTEVVVMDTSGFAVEGEHVLSYNTNLGRRIGPIEVCPDYDTGKKIIRDPIELRPDYDTGKKVVRDPIELLPDYGPWMIHRPPVRILPF